MPDYGFQRARMVRELAGRHGIADRAVLNAMREIPRHRFVPPHLESKAYENHALPLGDGQTISQPFVVARMTERLRVEPHHTVLEVGTGSGYQAAVLSLLARRVFSLERSGELAHEAIRRLRALGLANVKVQTFDGTLGWSEIAPVDRIVVTAGAPEAPQPLLEQLGPKGIMVIPEGDRRTQRLVVYRRLERGVRRTEHERVAFVPLVGRHGWEES